MKCETFKNMLGSIGDYVDPELYWENDGMNICMCGHSARHHNRAGRACDVCSMIKEITESSKVGK